MYSDLIAPRPVRIATFAHFHPPSQRPITLRLPSAPADSGSRPADDDLDDDRTSPLIRDAVSPRLSPRLPSEALEEFLAILRPTLFSPSSPTPRGRRYPLPNRSFSLSIAPLERLDTIPIASRDDARTPAKHAGGHRSPRLTTPHGEKNENDGGDLTPQRFGPLASPVSRIHTRNPFQRHPSYDVAPKASPISPRMAPLPPPTPSEQEAF